MAHVILSVDADSPAARAGVRAGDCLLSIDGRPIVDFLDFQLACAQPRLTLALRRGGEQFSVRIRKDEYQALGLSFENAMMSPLRMCCNRCLFCFVDQLPDHVRPSLRVKDDDWRTSLMMGSYVTLTNVSDAELARIVSLHASPLYVSVHATDPDVRELLLGTDRARRLMRQLEALSEGGIAFHGQCVLCPGLNDGPVLERTIEAFSRLPGALSMALVPVGITGHRQGLTPLRKYTRDEARAVIAQADRWRERLLSEKGTRFVFPSDEFYLQADWPIPPDGAYEDYAQIDDGVGMLRLLETEYLAAREALLPGFAPRKTWRPAIACGMSAAPFLRRMLSCAPVPGAQVAVHAVENRFFGPEVTVSGLITGGDLTRAMADVDCDAVLITATMLRDGEDRFLDDMTLDEAIGRLGKPIVPVGRSGEDLLRALMRLNDA